MKLATKITTKDTITRQKKNHKNFLRGLFSAMFTGSLEAALSNAGNVTKALWSEPYREYQEEEARQRDRRVFLQNLQPAHRVLGQSLLQGSRNDTFQFVKRSCDTRDFICESRGCRLEPFQKEIFCAIVASRLDRVFGTDASNHRLVALQLLGVLTADDVASYRRNPTSARVNALIEEYSRKCIVVKAPRRSGKNFAAQIAVVALLLHEPDVRVVNWAQSVHCAMLNCEEIVRLLDVCKAKNPGISYRVVKEGLNVYPCKGRKSIFRVKPNTANVSNDKPNSIRL